MVCPVVGLRYHTQTAYKSLFALPTGHEEVAFPAVTLCPLSPGGVPALQQNYWKFRTFPSSDVDPAQPQVLTKAYLYRGAVVNCLQYNWDLTTYDSAASTQSAMVIRFGMDLTGTTDPFMMTGAIGVLHPQTQEPVFEDAPMFYAPLGQTTQVSVLNYYVRNTKREPTNNYFVAVPSTVSNHQVTGAQTNISQVILAYNQFGYYVESEYHVYRVWDWIGEVGGAAALLYFLQHGILWMTIGCARRTCYRQQRKARKAEESEHDAKRAPQLEVEEYSSNAAAAPTTATSQHARRKRPRKAGASDPNKEVEMDDTATPSRAPKPATGDRVIIDMADTLGDSSH